MIEQEILLPKCFYGSTKGTREAWRSMVRQAGANISKWKEVLDGVELVSYFDYPGPIVTRNDLRLWSTNDCVWQLNWIAELWPNEHVKQPLDWRRQLDLALEGMQRLWFTIGMLSRGFAGFGFTSHRENALFPWLERYIYWLPELDSLSSQFVFAEKYTGFWQLKGCESLSIIVLIAFFCGLVPESLANSCNEIPEGTLASVLLSHNAIEPCEGRYRAVRKQE